jgi:hypothetical protein
VKELKVSKKADAIKYILLKLSDWVKPVREAARTAIQSFFEDKYITTFINQLEAIEALQKVERIDLSAQYNSILQFILSRELSRDFYSALHSNDKVRLIYIRTYFTHKIFNRDLAEIAISDKSFLVRLEILKHLNKLDLNDQNYYTNKLLLDPSSQVRLHGLYSIMKSPSAFENLIYQLTSDDSASVRDLSRYILKYKQYNFQKIYRDRINKKENFIGSILGLAEIGSKEDIEIFKQNINKHMSKL